LFPAKGWAKETRTTGTHQGEEERSAQVRVAGAQIPVAWDVQRNVRGICRAIAFATGAARVKSNDHVTEGYPPSRQ